MTEASYSSMVDGSENRRYDFPRLIFENCREEYESFSSEYQVWRMLD